MLSTATRSTACFFRRRRRALSGVAQFGENVVALDQFAKGGVLLVKKAGVGQADKELASGGIGGSCERAMERTPRT